MTAGLYSLILQSRYLRLVDTTRGYNEAREQTMLQQTTVVVAYQVMSVVLLISYYHTQ